MGLRAQPLALACPLTKSMDCKKALLPNGGRNLVQRRAAVDQRSTARLPLRPLSSLGHVGRPKGVKGAYHTPNASRDRRRLVTSEMTQDAL